ncbi:MAG: hypothetical protein P1S46_11745 [bacterium]|nr:hypothetical protein [bacterium]
MAKKKVEKMLCTVSHEKPMPGGGYVQFEAGREYPIGVVPGGSPYFRPVTDDAGEAEED